MKSNSKSAKVAVLGIFSAMVIVLQLFSYSVKIGTFNLSLVLVPIVLAGTIFGTGYSTALGGVFGIVTLIAGITGLDAGCNMMWNASPVMTTVTALSKALLAGLATGLVSKLLRSKNKVFSAFLAAAAAPIVNTGVFCLLMVLFFKPTLAAWAGGTDIVYYLIFGLTGINFLIELGINMLLSPAIITVTKATRRYL